MWNAAHILTSVDERLNAHAELLNLSDEHRARARSLAYAGTIAALFHISAGELFSLLQPAFIRWLETTQHAHVVLAETVESEVQR